MLNVEIYTTKEVLNNKTLSQFPVLISKAKTSYDQLSDFQRKNLKENNKSSEKLISHLGYDKNTYISFEMYEMMKSLGYKINIKKILEYKHSNTILVKNQKISTNKVTKNNIEFLNDKRYIEDINSNILHTLYIG